MNATPKEEQGEQPQQERSAEGSISQGINAINNLARRGIPNPFGKTGIRLGGQAGRIAVQAGARFAAWLFASPVGWIIVATAIIFIITFVIVLSFGAPTMETDVNPAQTTPPTTMPAGIVTPTPAVP